MKEPEVVDSETYQELLHYFKYASSAYTILCPKPNGRVLVSHFSNPLLEIQGYVARDDGKKEFVVAFRGSSSISHILLDTQITLVPCTLASGIKAPEGCKVHSGFLAGWDSIALEIYAILGACLRSHSTAEIEDSTVMANSMNSDYSGYKIVTTGHSLGGALSTLCAIALQQRYKEVAVRNYTYGSPRVGNKLWAEFVSSGLGERAFRVVNAHDGVPTMIPRSLGYLHHGVEYWQPPLTTSVTTASSSSSYFPHLPSPRIPSLPHLPSPHIPSFPHTPSPENGMLKCTCPDGEENERCSGSVPSRGINEDHMVYLGILATTPFCL